MAREARDGSECTHGGADSTGCSAGGVGGGWTDRQADEFGEAVLAGVGNYKGRSVAILRGGFAGAAAAPQGPRDGDETIPERRAWGVFLSETRASAQAGMD